MSRDDADLASPQHGMVSKEQGPTTEWVRMVICTAQFLLSLLTLAKLLSILASESANSAGVMTSLGRLRQAEPVYDCTPPHRTPRPARLQGILLVRHARSASFLASDRWVSLENTATRLPE